MFHAWNGIQLFPANTNFFHVDICDKVYDWLTNDVYIHLQMGYNISKIIRIVHSQKWPVNIFKNCGIGQKHYTVMQGPF